MDEEKKRDFLLPASVLIAAVLIVGAIIYSTGLKNTEPQEQQASLQEAAQKEETQKPTGPQIDDDVILGDPKAPVTIFIFSDYQCPFCGKFFKQSELLIRKNYVETGKAKMIYKDLAFLGPESVAAAEAAECAKDQGKYWQYHDALIEAEDLDGQENNGNLNKEMFKKIASDLKMNTNEFLSCFDSQKYAAEVKKDIEEGKVLMGDRVSTPTIFINDQVVQGAYPYDTFSKIIDGFLNKR